MKVYLLNLLCFSFLGFVLSSCSPTTTYEKRIGSGGIILGGEANFSGKAFQSILPSSINDLSSAQAAINVLECLTQINSNGAISPALAESFSVDSTGQIHTFILKKGIKFHDDACFPGGEGREMKAEDVKYSLQQLCSKKPLNQAYSNTLKTLIEGAEDFYSGITDELTGVKVIDDYTIEINTKAPSDALPYLLAGIQFAIIPREAVEHYGDKAAVGTGPFMIRRTESGYTLVRHTNYYGKDALGNQLPYLDEVTVTIPESKESEINQVILGTLDAVTGLNQQAANQIVQNHLKKFEKNGNLTMESSGDIATTDQFMVRSNNLKDFKVNSDGTIYWAKVQKLRSEN